MKKEKGEKVVTSHKKKHKEDKPVIREFDDGNEEDYIYDEVEGVYVKRKSLDDDVIERDEEYSETKK